MSERGSMETLYEFETDYFKKYLKPKDGEWLDETKRELCPIKRGKDNEAKRGYEHWRSSGRVCYKGTPSLSDVH